MANPRYVTLVANTVTPLTLDLDYNQVEVVNLDGAAEIAYTVDGSTPTVRADGANVVTAGIGAFDTCKVPTSGATIVKLKAAAVVSVCVRGLM